MSKRGVALGVVLGAGAAIGGMIFAKRHGIIDYVQARIDKIADNIEEEINKVVKVSDDFEDDMDALSRGIHSMTEKEAKDFEERINMNKNNEGESASEKFKRLLREVRGDAAGVEADSIVIEADEEEIFADTDDEKFEEPVETEDDIECEFDDDDVVADEDDFVNEDDEDDDIEPGITEDDITDAKEDSVVVEAELPSDEELGKVSEEAPEEAVDAETEEK